MNEKFIFTLIIILTFLAMPVFAVSQPSNETNTRFVCGNSPPCNYTTIQGAINGVAGNFCSHNATGICYVNVSGGIGGVYAFASFNVTVADLVIQHNDSGYGSSGWINMSDSYIFIAAANVSVRRVTMTSASTAGITCGTGTTTTTICIFEKNGTNLTDINFTGGSGTHEYLKNYNANDTYLDRINATSANFPITITGKGQSEGQINITLRNLNVTSWTTSYCLAVDRTYGLNISNSYFANANGIQDCIRFTNSSNNAIFNTTFRNINAKAIFTLTGVNNPLGQNLTFLNIGCNNVNNCVYIEGNYRTTLVQKSNADNMRGTAFYFENADVNVTQSYGKDVPTGIDFTEAQNTRNVSNTTIEDASSYGVVIRGGTSGVAVHGVHFQDFNRSALPILITGGTVTVQRNNMSNTSYNINITNNAAHLIFDNDFNGSINEASASSCVLCLWNTTRTATTNIIGGGYVGGNKWRGWTGIDNTGDGLGDTLIPYTSGGNLASGTGDSAPLAALGLSNPNITNAYMTPNQSLYNNNLSFTFNVSPGNGFNILNSCNLTFYFPNSSNKAIGNATSQCDGANSSWRTVSFSVPVRADWNGTGRAELNVSDNATSTSITSLNLTFDTWLNITFGGANYQSSGAKGVNTSFTVPFNISTNESVQIGCGQVFGGAQANGSSATNVSNVFLYGCEINASKIGNMSGVPTTGLLGSSSTGTTSNRTFTVWFVSQTNTTNFVTYKWNTTFNFTQSQNDWRNLTITYLVAPQTNVVTVSFANGSNNWNFGVISSGTEVCNVYNLNATGNESAVNINLSNSATGLTLNGLSVNDSNFNLSSGITKDVRVCFTPTVSSTTNYVSAEKNYVYTVWNGGSSGAASSSQGIVATNGTINGYSVTTPLVFGTVNKATSEATTAGAGSGSGEEKAKKQCKLIFNPPSETGLRFTRLDKTLTLAITNNEDKDYVPDVRIIKPDVGFVNDASSYLKKEKVPTKILSGATEEVFITANPPDLNVTYEAIMTIGSSDCATINIPIKLNVEFESSLAKVSEKLGISVIAKFLNKGISDTVVKVWEVLLVIVVLVFGGILTYTKKILPSLIITIVIVVGFSYLINALGLVN